MPAGVWDYLTYPQGPGHGAVTTDEDGNELYVFHTWGDGVEGNGRDTRIGRVHWQPRPRPVLDMSKDEQVLPRPAHRDDDRHDRARRGIVTLPRTHHAALSRPRDSASEATATASATRVAPGESFTVTATGLIAGEQCSRPSCTHAAADAGIPAADDFGPRPSSVCAVPRRLRPGRAHARGRAGRWPRLRPARHRGRGAGVAGEDGRRCDVGCSSPGLGSSPRGATALALRRRRVIVCLRG